MEVERKGDCSGEATAATTAATTSNGGSGGSTCNRKRRLHEKDDDDETEIAAQQQHQLSLEGLVTPNFEELARRFPNDFGRAWRDVQNPRRQQRGNNDGDDDGKNKAGGGGPLSSRITQEFSIALARALLRVHFQLALPDLPDHHLCPPVPNRHYYVRWLQTQVLPSTTPNFHFDGGTPSNTGLDIGTGASCIYPLLFAATSNRSYRLYATDVDRDAVEIARRNVLANHLQAVIQVLLVPPTDTQQQQQQQQHTASAAQDTANHHIGPLRRSLDALPPEGRDERLVFCMTNPPFFDDAVNSERTDRRIGDGRQRAPMTDSEGSYPGGEERFVLDMIVDGLALFLANFANKNQQSQQRQNAPPVWSSCMCGKKNSWLRLKKILTTLFLGGPSHVMFTEFGPGKLTRWFLAWTFERPRIRSALAKMNTWTFTVPSSTISSAAAGQDAAVQDVINRVVEYIRTFPAANLVSEVSSVGKINNGRLPKWQQQVQVREREPAIQVAGPASGDGSILPKPIGQLLAGVSPECRMQLFLPPEGHFVVDIDISSSPSSASAVGVDVKAFQHSEYAGKVVDKMKSHMEGEVCRTNRRWRRKLKREQAMREQQGVPMDES